MRMESLAINKQCNNANEFAWCVILEGNLLDEYNASELNASGQQD